jgi:hypothetical protein
LIVEFIDFLSILTVSFSQVLEFLLQVLLLRLELRAKILMLGKVASQSSNLCVSRVENILLGIKFSVEISILLLSVNQEILLIINFLSESGNHIDIHFNSTFVVILHSSLLIGDSVEVLFKSQELILKKFVFTFSLTEFHGLSSKLSYQPIFMVLSNGGVG